MGRTPLGHAQLVPAAALLDFFRARMSIPPILVDASLSEDGLCTRDALVLHPRAATGETFPSTLAHELFHFWSRHALKQSRWSALPRDVPRFSAERSEARSSPAAANVEEIATDLLTERLCASAGVPFHSAYLVDLPHDLLSTRLLSLRTALANSVLPRAAPDTPSHLHSEIAALSETREALRRLSGFELSALALHELRQGTNGSGRQWPIQLAPALPAELESLAAALDALDGPLFLTLTCQAFARSSATTARSPFWSGDSPLSPDDRQLAGRLRDPESRSALRCFLLELASRT